MQSVKLNLIPGAVLPVVNVSQYDVKRTFALAVYDGAASYDLTGKTVTIRGTKPDNHGFDYGTSDGVVSVSGNTVTISTTQQMTAVGGQVMAELRIESGTTVIGTLNFIIDVEPSALSDETIISDTEIPVIERDFEAALAEAEADALVAEGRANGTQGGVPVESGSPYYHDNAKYYKEQAEEAASGVLEKYPKIVSDYWYIWDVDTEQYVNTGVRAKGTQGDPGQGVPAGGTTGQVLRKKSDDNYDTEWANGGGGASALDDLTDVDITSPASGQGLLYDGAEWVNVDVIVPDELTDELRDAEVIEGKNRAIQNGTRRTPASVTYTEEANGVIDVDGTATGSNSFYYISEHLEWPNEEMVISGCPSGGDASTYRLIVASSEDSGASVYVSDTGSGAIVPANTGGSTLTLDIYIRVAQNASVSHKKFSPMLCTKEEWDKSHEYEPYYEPLKDRKLDRAEQRVLGSKNFLKNTAVASISNSVTFTPKDDRTILVNGTPSADIYYNVGEFYLPAGMYKITDGLFDNSFGLLITGVNGSQSWNIPSAEGEKLINVTDPSYKITARIFISSSHGAVSNKIVKPMIRLASDPDDTYVPYAMTNKELTDAVKDTIPQNIKSLVTFSSNIAFNNDWCKIYKSGHHVYAALRFTTPATVSNDYVVLTVPDSLKPVITLAALGALMTPWTGAVCGVLGYNSGNDIVLKGTNWQASKDVVVEFQYLIN